MFSKSIAELVSDGGRFFLARWQSYPILVGMAVCMFLQVSMIDGCRLKETLHLYCVEGVLAEQRICKMGCPLHCTRVLGTDNFVFWPTLPSMPLHKSHYLPCPVCVDNHDGCWGWSVLQWICFVFTYTGPLCWYCVDFASFQTRSPPHYTSPQ